MQLLPRDHYREILDKSMNYSSLEKHMGRRLCSAFYFLAKTSSSLIFHCGIAKLALVRKIGVILDRDGKVVNVAK